MLRLFTFLYVLLAPFTAWFALSGWLRLPVVCILVALIWAAPFILASLGSKRPALYLKQEDVFFLGALIWIGVSVVTHEPTVKTWGHALAYVFSLLVYYLGFRSLISVQEIDFYTLSRWAAKSVMLCSLIVIVEWALANFLDFYIREYVIFDEETSNMLYYGQYFFKSVGGTAEEPSLMAYNLNMLMALGLFYAQQKGTFYRNVYLLLYLAAMFCIASSGGIGFIVIAFLIVHANRVQGYLNLAKALLVAILPLAVFYQLNSIFVEQRVMAFLESIYDKFTFQHQTASMRMWAWRNAWNDWLESPLVGKGPGYGNLEFYDGFGYQSLYFKLLAENGWPALLLMLSFFFFLVLKARFTQPQTRVYLMLALLAGFFHLSIHDAFYHPALWVTIVAMQAAWREQRVSIQESLATA